MQSLHLPSAFLNGVINADLLISGFCDYDHFLKKYSTRFPGALEKYVKILEEKFKNETLKQVYAGINGREVDDPEMQAFFKFKCWI